MQEKAAKAKAEAEEEESKKDTKKKGGKEEEDQPNIRPRICVGVCRENFEVNTDLERQNDVWALNLATGDKYNKK